jgi:putative alpha-1,2-mannosidase
MVQNSPDTEGQFAYGGYLWSDATIRGLSLVHISGLESIGQHSGPLSAYRTSTTNPIPFEAWFGTPHHRR